MGEPIPPDPAWPRYTSRPFPPYRYRPDVGPHPRRDPEGHSYGDSEPTPFPFSADTWQSSEWYLYAIDLYNFAYWWECHEVFEALWNAAGRHSTEGVFFRGLLQIAAGNLKRTQGLGRAANDLARRGLANISAVPANYMGVDVTVFTNDVSRYFDGTNDKPALIRLALPEK